MAKVNSRNVDAPGRYQYHYNANMTDEQRAAATKKLEDMKKSGRVTIKNDGYGLSQSFMENILKEQIEAGNIVDKNDDGEEDIFTNMNKRNLGASFETTHKAKGYSTDFTHMKKGTSFEYTYDEMKNYIDKAGYKFKEPTPPKAPATPATPDPVASPAVDDKNVQPPSETPVAPPATETPKNDKLDTVILDATTYTDENGNVIADDTKALVNGQPYHSRTGFNTFGTLTPDTVDWKQYSMKELDKLDGAPTGKKVTANPDSVPTAPASDKGSASAPQITVSETPVVENEPVTPAPKTEAPVTTEVKAQPPVEAKNDEPPTPVVENEPVTPAPKTEAPVTTEVKAQPPVEAKNDEPPTPVAVNEPVTPAPKTETPAVASEPKTAKENFETRVATDSELANADVKQRPVILGQRISGMERQIADLKRTTSKTTGALFWKKTVTTNGAEVNKDRIAGLEKDLDSAQRDKIYADAVAGNITGFGATSLVDENDNTVASYPQYSTVKYKDANGQESYVARVMEYNTTTHKSETKYYSFDVQKVNDLKGLPERWQAVPDMKNQLTDGQEVR